jgi:membrane associated rhomboid family serine protease
LRTGSEAFRTSAFVVSVLFASYFIEQFFPHQLRFLGIYPRTLWGLVGIFFSPFLHANAAHLMANSFSLVILLTLLFWDRRYFPEQTLILIWFLSGLGTWVIGRQAEHIGASGVIYGLVSYLIAAGWWMRSWRALITGGCGAGERSSPQ